MPDIPLLVSGVLLVILGLLYIGGPLAILGTFIFRAPARIVYFSRSEIRPPEEVSAYLDRTTAGLVQLGFEPVAHFCLPDLVNNAQSINVLFSHRSVADCAIVNCIYAGAFGDVTLQDTHFEFVTRFRDDVVVQTNNCRQIGALRQPAEVHTIQFWDLDNVAELYRRHKCICERLTNARPRSRLIEEFRNDVEQYLQVALIRDPLEYQVSLGWFRPVEEGYRPTVKGAFLLAWQEMFPWKGLRKLARKRAAQRWLAEIGG